LVVIEDKTTVEQMRLIQQLDEEDKQSIIRLVEKMLTNRVLPEKRDCTLKQNPAIWPGFVVYSNMIICLLFEKNNFLSIFSADSQQRIDSSKNPTIFCTAC